MLEKNLIRANEDIVTVSAIAKSMGWGAVSEQSFQRVLYLVQVLYSFKHEGIENIFSYYHFTVTTFGPLDSNQRPHAPQLLKEYLYSLVLG